jgi:O-antigen ligase
MSATIRRSDAALALFGVLVGVAAGALVAHALVQGAALVVAALLLALVLTRPVIVAVASCVCVFAAYRSGAGLPVGSNGLSYSDVALAMATVVAVPSLANGLHVKRLRVVAVGIAVYLIALLPTVLLDESHRGWLEWGHRLMLVGGGVAVGYWVASQGLARVTLRLIVLVASIVAVVAMYDAVRSGFAAAYPLGLNKNFAGAQLSLMLIVALTTRRTLQLRVGVEALLVVVIAGGLIATQSRGSMLAAATALLAIAAFSPRIVGKRARAALALMTIVLAGFVFFSIRSQLSLDEQDLNNSSIGVRQQVEKRSHEIWRTSPIHGVGLKYFNSGEWGRLAQPPNIVVDNELAESGVVGLVGFIVLQGAAVTAGVRRRKDSHLALVGAACVLGALVHGMVDIYWIAGSVTLPFILLGMGLGAADGDMISARAGSQARSRAHKPTQTRAARRTRVPSVR